MFLASPVARWESGKHVLRNLLKIGWQGPPRGLSSVCKHKGELFLIHHCLLHLPLHWVFLARLDPEILRHFHSYLLLLLKRERFSPSWILEPIGRHIMVALPVSLTFHPLFGIYNPARCPWRSWCKTDRSEKPATRSVWHLLKGEVKKMLWLAEPGAQMQESELSCWWALFWVAD